MFTLIDKIGSRFLGSVHYVLMLLGLIYLSIKVLWTDRDLGQRDFWRQVLLQIYFTGVQSAGPVIILALTIGVFVIVEGVGGIGSLSGAESLGRMITVVVLREVGPLLTGGVVIVRSVTAVAAELGVMQVQREIEALEVMGVSPIRHLISPRIFGGLTAFLGLSVLFGAAALGGGYFIARMLVAIPADLFFRAVASAITPSDLVAFTAKIVFGGLGVFAIGCYHGMNVSSSPTEVPMAVSRASLNALVFLVVFQGSVSVLMILRSSAGSLLTGVL